MTEWDDEAEVASAIEVLPEAMLETRINDLLAVGQRERARRLAEEFLARAPASAFAHYILSRVCEADRQLDAGLAAAAEAVRLAPDWADAHTRRGTVLFQLGRFAEAETALRAALALQPDDVPAMFGYAQLLSACDRSEALPLVERVLELDPELSIAHALRAELLLWLNPGRWRISLAAAQRAVQLDPEDDLAHAILGHLLLNQDKVKEAEARFRAALKLAPHSALAVRGLARVLMAQNIFYRPMLWYSVTLRRFGTAGQFALVIGLWVMVSAATALLRSWYAPAGLINAVMVGYLVFCLYTWFADRVMIWLLKRHYPWLPEVHNV